MRSILALVAACAVGSAPFVARADEGMWTFDAFPTAKMTKTFGFAPDRA